MCLETDEALAGIPALHKLADDLIVYSETKTQLMECVYLVMERCRKHGITLSASKAQVGEEVKFAGLMVGRNGIKSRPSKDRGSQELTSAKGPHQSQVLPRACQPIGQVLFKHETNFGTPETTAIKQECLRLELRTSGGL